MRDGGTDGFRDKRREALEEKDARKQAKEEGWSGPQWEYLPRNLDKVAGMVLEDDFNKRGREGWQFVAEAKGYAIFKGNFRLAHFTTRHPKGWTPSSRRGRAASRTPWRLPRLPALDGIYEVPPAALVAEPGRSSNDQCGRLVGVVAAGVGTVALNPARRRS